MVYPLVGFYFKVLFGDGKVIDEISFSKVSGVDFELLTEYDKSIVSNDNIIKPSGYKYSDLVLSRGITSKKSLLFNWINLQATQGKILTLTLTVNLLNEKSEPVLSWTFFDAFPIKYTTSDLDAKSNEVMIESITLKYASFKYDQIDYVPKSSSRKAKKNTPGPIKLKYEKREIKKEEVSKKYQKNEPKLTPVKKKYEKKDSKASPVKKKYKKKYKFVFDTKKKYKKKESKVNPVKKEFEKKIKKLEATNLKRELKSTQVEEIKKTPLTISPEGEKSSRRNRRTSQKKPPK